MSFARASEAELYLWTLMKKLWPSWIFSGKGLKDICGLVAGLITIKEWSLGHPGPERDTTEVKDSGLILEERNLSLSPSPIIATAMKSVLESSTTSMPMASNGMMCPAITRNPLFVNSKACSNKECTTYY